MVLKLFVRELSIKVVIHLTHEFIHLAFANGESKQLEQAVELTHLDVVIVIIVNLTEYFVESESTLVNDLE
jgi:hypothetical protein